MNGNGRVKYWARGSFMAASLVAVLAVGSYIHTVIRIDPYSRLKKTTNGVDPEEGARMVGVHLESYEGEKLVTKANFDSLTMRQDRQFYDLKGVTDGVWHGTKGTINFSTPTAEWNVRQHQLEAPDGAHLKGKDFDFDAPQFVFNANTSKVNVPGTVKGKLAGGDLKAMAVEYEINTGNFKTGKIQWQGQIALSFQEPEQSSTRTWKIEGESSDSKGDLRHFVKGIGTDGDIIIMADNIVHNKTTDIVTATGNVRYFSPKANMICEKAVIERKIKKATLTGKVQMLMKAKENQTTVSVEDGIPPYRPLVPDEIAKSRPKAETPGQTPEQKKLIDEIRSGKNVRDYPTVCYADRIEYWYKKKERHAIMTGDPQARQDFPDGAWRQIWTTTGYYDGEKETLRMVSAEGQMSTRMINSIGDDFRTDWCQTSTKEGEDDMSTGKVTGYMADYSDEIPKDDKATGGGTGGAGVKPPPRGRMKQPADKTGGLLGPVANPPKIKQK